MTNIIKDAKKIEEFWTQLEGIASDDKKEIEEYSVAEILSEAIYCESTFREHGHYNNEEMIDEYGDNPERAKDMRKQYRALKRFIIKYKKEAA